MHEDPTGVTQTVVLEPTPTPTTLHPAFPGGRARTITLTKDHHTMQSHRRSK